MKHFIYLLAFLVSCTSSSNENTSTAESMGIDSTRIEVEIQKAVVMEGHDIAMEKMGEMIKLKSSLKEKLAIVDSSKKESYQIAIQNLEDADKFMWDWMHGYKAPVVDTSSIENALEYLDDQKLKIDIVADKISSSLKNGYELLEK